jgi:hypothetical protein
MAVLLLLGLCSSSHYTNFKVSVYCPANDVAKMENITWFETTWKTAKSKLIGSPSRRTETVR